MLLAALFLLASAQPDCRFDRPALMALGQDAFDQDMKGGWRVLDDRGCHMEAADLLRDYREAQPRPHPSVLFWHEGQIRAIMGQTDAAIGLFGAAREAPADDVIGWNLYVDGSVAFLKHDRPALQRARDALARIPRPAEYRLVDRRGKPVRMAWPPNLDVLDGFLKCFDRSYADAYGSRACSTS